LSSKEFKNSFSSNIFKHKYAFTQDESWHQRAITIVDSVCGTAGGKVHPILSETEREQLVEYITDFKFMPGGRYIYYSGREAKFYNNCLHGGTSVLTKSGWAVLRENVGKTLEVLSPVDGQYYPATFHRHGVQKLQEITFSNLRGHQDHTWKVRATRTHRWPLASGKDTFDLRVGDVVPANGFNSGEDDIGFIHGMVFGDGNSNGQLRLCADKDKKYLEVLSKHGSVTYPPSAEGDPVVYFKHDIDWKALPKEYSSPAYVSSFIRGWLAADGSEIEGNKLCSVNEEALHWFRANAPMAGIVITGELREQIRDVSIGEYSYNNHSIYIQSYQYGSTFSGFKVIDIQESSEEEVFCPYEPVHQRIIIDHGIDTGNCYLLRAEEDTREEWSDLTRRAMSCLMTGGGIGVDYSRLRPSGRLLRRTGGVASGPIPLMYTLNEVGRNVMQGGSRRSAIYASLNWQHEDAEAFLKCKNWHDMPVGKAVVESLGEDNFADYTMKHAKMDDFNFAAPMDMTNISLNYDDAWLKNPLNETFLTNVRQAMSTGEPGFSFNFGDKENETLRNACTEVTSEDDSDVCNLGSVNMGAIESLDEFRQVVQLASKFLVCGTIRAELPYEKVYKVREKNRRLGLGLMGIHEWLLKRRQPYEVTPDLHNWLKVYKDESTRAANEHCDRLYISYPIAYRAIAPTGSIGILAATTTGIEPLFAVAYKRRYLTEGTKWKYEYVVDSVADSLIKQYGLDPDKIDTALDLANDYERRIKFQADIQDYVDMSISSTINLPSWGSRGNNEDKVRDFSITLAKYARRLRGFTCYPDGARGGQPLTRVEYKDALEHKGVVFEESDICTISGKGGVCGA
jgi:ribonucleoside-diphosphate reductase alpha chain